MMSSWFYGVPKKVQTCMTQEICMTSSVRLKSVTKLWK